MDLQPDQAAHELYSCSSRLKIRRSPSCKVSAAASPPSSFHGSCSTTNQPLIIHTLEPEIITTEPAEFMWVVQRLTGSPDTRRSLRESKRRWRAAVQSIIEVQDVQLRQQGNDDSSSKEATRAALITGDSDTNICINSSPLSPNSSDLSDNSHDHCQINHPLNFNYHINCQINHPSSSSSSLSSTSANSEENTNCPPPSSPISPSSSNVNSRRQEPCQCLPCKCNPSSPKSIMLGEDNPIYTSVCPNSWNCKVQNQPPRSPSYPNPKWDTNREGSNSPIAGNHILLALPISEATELSNRDEPWSPLSSTSGLTKATTKATLYPSSEEDGHGHIGDLSSRECCALPSGGLEGGNHVIHQADEDESNFFVFSLDSYYGNLMAAQDAAMAFTPIESI